uniref:Metalloendopeptidase n=1 Tax=Timema cristinae TaxID=61476 RepID=A0A7R9D8Q3_TIMCR|nr:unnamed protein product [Timema cristinae]
MGPLVLRMDQRVQQMGQSVQCASLVGYQHTPQDVQLTAPACLIKPGTIQHEFLHALGFWHEHTRPDRDTYIKIAWQNIQSGMEVNFKARLSSEAQTFGFPYDYGSVMHYRATAFSKDGNSATIVPSDNDELFKIGQREKASTIDLAKLNKLYNCNTS